MAEARSIEATIRYLTTEEGGRQGPVASGYRGQFHYQGEEDKAWHGFQYFPGLPKGDSVPLGVTVQAVIKFPPHSWEKHHSHRLYVGMPFEIREGRKLVGRGTVTGLDVEAGEF